jgi:hypothetical protein
MQLCWARSAGACSSAIINTEVGRIQGARLHLGEGTARGSAVIRRRGEKKSEMGNCHQSRLRRSGPGIWERSLSGQVSSEAKRATSSDNDPAHPRSRGDGRSIFFFFLFFMRSLTLRRRLTKLVVCRGSERCQTRS